MDCARLRQQRLDALDDLDDVGARLAADDQQRHRALAVGPAGDPVVLDVVDHPRHVAQPHGRAVLVGDDQIAVARRRRRADRWRRWSGSGCAPGNAPLGWSTVAWPSDGAHVLDAQAQAGERGRVDLHAHGGLLAAAHEHLAHALHLGDLLRQDGVGGVVDLGRAAGVFEVSERIRMGASAGLTLRKLGRVGRFGGRSPAAALMAACTSRAAASTSRSRSNCRVKLTEPSELTEVISVRPAMRPKRRSERGGHRRGHGLGAGARQGRVDVDGGEVDPRQRRDRELGVGGAAREKQRRGQQRSRHRPPDEGFGDVHGALVRSAPGRGSLGPAPWAQQASQPTPCTGR